MSERYTAKLLVPDEIDRDTVDTFYEFLMSEYLSLGIPEEQARQMAFGEASAQERLDGMRRLAEDSGAANYYTVMEHDTGNTVGAAVIGPERFDDRPDTSWLFRRMGRVAEKLGWITPDIQQVFAYGVEGHIREQPKEDVAVFATAVDTARGNSPDAASKLSVFADDKNFRMPRRMKGKAFTYFEIGQPVKTSVNGVVRWCRRIEVDVDATKSPCNL